MKWYQLDKKYIIDYLILSALSLIYVLPLILVLNHFYFNDDLGWSLWGGIGFKGDGRPLSEFLVHALSDGEPITDTAPLPLILAVLFLSYTLILYAKNNLSFVSNRYVLLAVLLFIITNPCIVECMTYRYGCMNVLFSLGLPFIIFSIPDTVSKMKIFIYSTLLSMALLSLHQSALGMCLILFITNIFFLLFQIRKVDYAREGLRIIGIGTGAIIYKVVIASHYINHSDWRYTASQTLEFKPESILAIFQNIFDTCNYIMRFLSETAFWYQILLALMIILSMFLTTALYYRESEKKGWRKAVNISFLLLSPICVFVSSFIVLMILEQQTLKLRIFTSLGGVLLYLGILLMFFMKKHQNLMRPLLLLLILCNFYHYTYIYSYGNAVNNQHEYAKYIVYNVAHDLETINADKEFTRLSFNGRMPSPRRTQIFREKYPMTGILLPRYFTNDTWRGGAYVLHYLQDDLTLEAITDADQALIDSNEPVVANSLYSCYVSDDKIIVSFHESGTPEKKN